MSQSDNVIESIHRAIRSEEKQGHINTGAIGSFSAYLLEIYSGANNTLTTDFRENLKCIAELYTESSPYKRRGLLTELKQRLNTLEADQANLNVSNSNIMEAVKSESIEPELIKQEPVVKNKPDITTENNNLPGISGENNIHQKTLASQSLQYLKGVGPQRAKQFENLGIYTIEDLIKHFPRRYELRIKRKISDLQDGEIATICGKVTGSQMTRGRVKVIKLNIEQEGKFIHAVWFNQEYIIKQFPIGTEVTVTGKVQWNKRVPEILANDIVKGFSDGPDEEMIAVYSETARLNSKAIRGVMKLVLPQTDKLFVEYLPEGEQKFLERSQAYKEIHLPDSPESAIKARARLVVEEILFLQLALARLRTPRQEEPSPILNKGGEIVRRFISQLPFKLTSAQQRVIKEIFRDMQNGQKAMTRLIQGDVGSGKTAVAMCAILQSVGSGFQAAMMAPTEVLAQQHYESLKTSFEPLGVKVGLLVGSQNKTEREQILGQVYSGKTHVVVGTHALIQETVRFNSLGLVVTDEQHRFGVRQRTLLQDKGENPHVLVMTATPIPRTLALTLYGDLQLSVIDEMPAGRKTIITKKISDRNRPSLEKFLEQHIAEGRQIYVVCPLVEETEKSDLVSATQTAEDLRARFPKSKVALLHGRMKGYEKENIMHSFRNGDIDVLVATTVIEVGVNVPNASVMVIEGAERFGLAQLHQLRGRVGRGEQQSYCILISNVKDSARLNILCETENGFVIAEEDLKIRGPGELLGLRQHGIPELKLTDLSKDGVLIEEAYRILQKALADPDRYKKLYQEVEKTYPKVKVGIH